MNHLQRTIIVAASVLAAVGTANAQLIAYEGFNYNPGLDVGAASFGGLNGGTGWTTGWGFSTAGNPAPTVKTQAGSLLTGGITSGGSAIATPGALTNLTREFTTNTGRIWASVSIRYTSILSNSVLEFNLSQAGSNGGPGTDGASKYEIRTDGSGVTTMKTFHDFPGGFASSAFTPVVGQVYNFVMTYETSGAAPTGIYVNPTLGAPTVGGFSASNVWNSGNYGMPSGTSRFRMFYDRVGFEIDEIRIGRTYADVTPVPEPMTMGLLALGAAAVAARRRRKS